MCMACEYFYRDALEEYFICEYDNEHVKYAFDLRSLEKECPFKK